MALPLVLFFGVLRVSRVAHALSEINYSGANTGLAGDDYTSGPFSLGFNFDYFGHTYTSGYPSTNGNFALVNNNNYYWVNEAFNNGGTWTNTIYPFWDDLITKNFQDASIYYTTIGAAPLRQFIVQWTNMYFYEHPDVPMGTFQMILDEGTNVIHFQYRDLLGGSFSLGDSATIGIKGNDDTQYSEVSVNTASLSQGQAITFTPNGDNYDVNTDATYLPVYVLPPGVPASPSVINPADNLTGAITTPTFEWGSVDLATSYNLLISDQPDFSTTIVNVTDLTDTTYTLDSPLDYSTTYYWKVAAVNTLGSSYSTTRSFTTAALSFPAPDTPSQLSSSLLSGSRINPTTLSSTPIKMRLTDSDHSQQVRYRLQIATSSDFDNLVVDYRSPYDSEGNTETFSFGTTSGTYLTGSSSTTLTDDQNYYVRVASEDQHAQSSDWTGPVGIAFTYDSIAPETPSTPALQGAATKASTILAWAANSEVHPADPFYRLQYSTDSDFSKFTTINLNTTSTVITGLNAGTYYTRLLAKDSAGNMSVPSSILTFSVENPPSPTAAASIVTPQQPATTSDSTATTTPVHTSDLLVHITGSKNQAMQGVLVTLHSVVQTAYTDSQGNVRFTNVAAGTHHVEAKYSNMMATTTVYVTPPSTPASAPDVVNVYLQLQRLAAAKQHVVTFRNIAWLSGLTAIAATAGVIIKKRRIHSRTA